MRESVALYVASQYNPRKENVRIIRMYDSDPALFSGFQFVQSIGEADYVLIPQRLSKMTPEWRSYFDTQKQMARREGKQIILFIGTDLGHTMHVPDTLVFKGSAYKSALQENEAVHAIYAEDLSTGKGIRPRKKKDRPLVSFCGYAGFPTLESKLKYHVKNAALNVGAFVTRDDNLKARKRGIFFRRNAMKFLSNHSAIDTNFIVRDRFTSGAVMQDSRRVREEYIASIEEADYVLTPKGDGNASMRFYEVLSLGRIPLLIDTDMSMPFEATLDYTDFSLRVSHGDLARIGDIVGEFHASLSADRFEHMQSMARKAYVEFLRFDSYFNRAFPLLREKGMGALR